MSRYPELAAKVDAFFARVQARHAADMRCGSGCHHCCHVRLSVTRVEADAIRAEIARWPDERKQILTANVAAAAPKVEGPGPAPGPGPSVKAPGPAPGAETDRCAALAPDGLCLIYAARPIVCRSHGAPIRMRDARSLPVVQACRENFVAHGPAAADPDCILDQTTLSAMVLAVDRDAGHDGERIDLAAVLADC